jgi:glycosyltransferase involved in cell wall biosynthesis
MAGTPSYLQSLEAVLGSNKPPAAAGASAANASAAGAAEAPKLPSFLTAANLAQGLTTSNGGSTAGKLKVLMVTTHAHQVTGYSKIAYGFLKQMAKQPNLAVTHFGFQRNPQLPPNFRIYPPNVRVLDAAEMERRGAPPNAPLQGFGYNVLPDVIRHEKPDVVFIYNDLMVVSRFLEEIRKSGIPRTFKIWVYVDQVYNTQLQVFLDILNRDADRVFTFTAHWKKVLKDQGITRPIDVLLHGFEREFFFPVPREEARKRMGLPNDAFLMMSLNRNQPRKRYDILIMAFAELVAKQPTKPVFLLCICDKGEKGGWWLVEIWLRELKLRGLPVEKFANRLMISDREMSFRDEEINIFYNAADVGVATPDGEGWGLCNFEQMGVGVPQIVPDIGGFKEYCNADNSMLVKPKYRMYHPTAFCSVGGEAEIVDPHDVCIAMEEYLMDSEKRRKHGEEARKTVLGYTYERACETFLKRLTAELEEKDE